MKLEVTGEEDMKLSQRKKVFSGFKENADG